MELVSATAEPVDWRMRAKHALFGALDRCGATALCAHANRHDVLILSYHAVLRDELAHAGLWARPAPLKTSELRMQLTTLRARGYRFISLADALETLAGRGPRQARGVCLTFDDGYRNNLTDALPILREFGAPAAIFIATAFVDRTYLLWFDRLDYSLTHAPDGVCVRAEVGGAQHAYTLGSVAARSDAVYDLLARLKQLPADDVERIVDQIQEQCGRRLADRLEQEPRVAPLTWDEVRALRDAGVTIGSHTVTHTIMARVSPERMAREAVESRARLERELDRPVEFFAYPNGQPGAYDALSRAALLAAGYRAAVTTRRGRARIGTDQMTLPRMPGATLTDPRIVTLRASGLDEVLSTAKRWARGGRAGRAGA